MYSFVAFLHYACLYFTLSSNFLTLRSAGKGSLSFFPISTRHNSFNFIVSCLVHDQAQTTSLSVHCFGPLRGCRHFLSNRLICTAFNTTKYAPGHRGRDSLLSYHVAEVFGKIWAHDLVRGCFSSIFSKFLLDFSLYPELLDITYSSKCDFSLFSLKKLVCGTVILYPIVFSRSTSVPDL